MYYTLFFLPSLLYLLWTVRNLVKNFATARQLHLPTFIVPLNPPNPLWALFLAKPLVPLLMRLPLNLGSWARISYFGWSFDDKYRIHDELGDVFVAVTTGGIEVHIANAAAVNEILARRRDFPKPVELYSE
jgi:hypothetical protein